MSEKTLAAVGDCSREKEETVVAVTAAVGAAWAAAECVVACAGHAQLRGWSVAGARAAVAVRRMLPAGEAAEAAGVAAEARSKATGAAERKEALAMVHMETTHRQDDTDGGGVDPEKASPSVSGSKTSSKQDLRSEKGDKATKTG